MVDTSPAGEWGRVPVQLLSISQEGWTPRSDPLWLYRFLLGRSGYQESSAPAAHPGGERPAPSAAGPAFSSKDYLALEVPPKLVFRWTPEGELTQKAN